MRRIALAMLVSVSLAMPSFVTPASAFLVKAAPEGTTYPDPGITDDTIKIGIFGPLSGPSTAIGIDNLRLHTAWFDMLNERGGIWGRKIEYIVEDDKCTAEGVNAAVKKLVEEDKVFMLHGGVCSASLYGIKDYVERNKIPLITLNAAADGLVDPPSPYIVAGPAITIHTVAASAGDFAVSYLKGKRIAYIRHDDAYGDWATEALEYQLKDSGAEIVAMEAINPALTDLTAPMLKIRAANPDVVMMLTYPRPSALAIKKAQELGMKMPIVLGATGAADLKALVENVGNKDAFANLYYQDSINDLPTGPKQKWVHDIYKQRYPDLAAQPGKPSDYFSNDVGGFLLVSYALMMAGPVPTRENLVKAMQNIWFETGSQAGPFNLSPTDRSGNETTRFLKFDGETRTPVEGQWVSKWDPVIARQK